MIDGKKTKSYFIVTQIVNELSHTGQDPIDCLMKAVDNVKPLLEVKKRRIAGSTHYVPYVLSPSRQENRALRWLLEAASKRRIVKKKALSLCLVDEFKDAYNQTGVVKQKRDELHKQAEANRGFAHYRWW